MPADEDMRRTAKRLYLWPVAGWLALLGVGYLPTLWLGGSAGVAAMVVGQTLVVTVVYGTLVPTMRRMVSRDAKKHLQMGLAAGVVRLLVTMGLAAVMLWRGMVEPAAFLLWLGITYIIMIKIETQAIIRWSKQLGSLT